MFGAPSGALFDPADAVSRGGAIEEGWLLAPLDLRLATDKPYGAEVRPGTVAGLLVAPEAEAPLVFAKSVVAVAGRGIEGDRYGAGRGTFSVWAPETRAPLLRSSRGRRERVTGGRSSG